MRPMPFLLIDACTGCPVTPSSISNLECKPSLALKFGDGNVRRNRNHRITDCLRERSSSIVQMQSRTCSSPAIVKSAESKCSSWTPPKPSGETEPGRLELHQINPYLLSRRKVISFLEILARQSTLHPQLRELVFFSYGYSSSRDTRSLEHLLCNILKHFLVLLKPWSTMLRLVLNWPYLTSWNFLPKSWIAEGEKSLECLVVAFQLPLCFCYRF